MAPVRGRLNRLDAFQPDRQEAWPELAPSSSDCSADPHPAPPLPSAPSLPHRGSGGGLFRKMSALGHTLPLTKLFTVPQSRNEKQPPLCRVDEDGPDGDEEGDSDEEHGQSEAEHGSRAGAGAPARQQAQEQQGKQAQQQQQQPQQQQGVKGGFFLPTVGGSKLFPVDTEFRSDSDAASSCSSSCTTPRFMGSPMAAFFRHRLDSASASAPRQPQQPHQHQHQQQHQLPASPLHPGAGGHPPGPSSRLWGSSPGASPLHLFANRAAAREGEAQGAHAQRPSTAHGAGVSGIPRPPGGRASMLGRTLPGSASEKGAGSPASPAHPHGAGSSPAWGPGDLFHWRTPLVALHKAASEQGTGGGGNPEGEEDAAAAAGGGVAKGGAPAAGVSVPRERVGGREEGEESAALWRAYEQLTAQRAVCRSALGTQGATHSGLPSGDFHAMERMFEALTQANEQLEEALWPCIRDFPGYAKERPGALTTAAEVIAKLERDVQEKHGGGGRSRVARGGAAAAQMVHYRDRCFEEVEKGAEERFKDLWEHMVRGRDVDALLEEFETAVGDLLHGALFLGPLLPAQYCAVPALRKMCLARLARAGRKLGAARRWLTPPGILKILAWEGSTLRALAKPVLAPHMEAQAGRASAEPLGAGALEPLLEEYVLKTQRQLERAFQSLQGREKARWDLLQQQQPSSSLEGQQGEQRVVEATVAEEVFGLLGAELARVKALPQCQKLLGHMVQGLGQVLFRLQEMQSEELESSSKGGQLALLSVLVNALRAAELTVRLEGSLREELANAGCGDEDVNLEDVVAGFRALGKQGAKQAVLAAFSTTAMLEAARAALYREPGGEEDRPPQVVGGSDEGQNEQGAEQGEAEDGAGEGGSGSALVGGVQRLLQAWEQQLQGRAMRVVAEACLDRLVVVYLERLLDDSAPLSLPLLWGMEQDGGHIQGLFPRWVGAERVQTRVQVLLDMGSMAGADSVDTLVMGYASVLATSWPQCSVALVERLVAARTSEEDFSSEEAGSIVEQCREIWSKHSLPVGGGPSDRSNSFLRYALEA